jgi:hypothetical protein
MSLFDNSLFGDLGQVTLPEPASDALIRELAITGGRPPSRTVEPAPSTDVATKTAGSKMLPASGGMPTWAPTALIGGGVIFAGLLIWSATRRPTPNRRRRSHRRSR